MIEFVEDGIQDKILFLVEALKTSVARPEREEAGQLRRQVFATSVVFYDGELISREDFPPVEVPPDYGPTEDDLVELQRGILLNRFAENISAKTMGDDGRGDSRVASRKLIVSRPEPLDLPIPDKRDYE